MADNLEKLTDEELAALALSDEAAFKLIISRYKDRLFYYLKRLTLLSSDDLDDILQQVFIKIYYNLNGFDSSLKFSSWAYRIAHNEAMNYFRKNKVKTEDLDKAVLADDLSDLEADMDRHLESETVKLVLAELDHKYREVLSLKYFAEKNYQEISDILAKPMGTVATLVNRAKKQFQDKYKIYAGKN
ncbi:MAG TPA: sigma-70 family RNA polymerase sigma factor [bacterium]|nr:sigma-70 family RNA polymerase sigma factor [bacterium]HPT29495.1 sigma-70 family RNA polymerase sigma factor [bacterium]